MGLKISTAALRSALGLRKVFFSIDIYSVEKTLFVVFEFQIKTP